jgi:hypothetical protein
MPQLVEMDRHVSLFEQMEELVGSVILINTFTVEPEEVDQLQQAWASDAAFMKQQPVSSPRSFTGGPPEQPRVVHDQAV